MSRAMLTPSLGVTGVLAALWALAVTLGGAAAPSARALDPAVAGSVAAAWGTVQLGAIAILALAAAAPWTLILGPALLLLGEAGELHLMLAAAVGGQAWAKGAEGERRIGGRLDALRASGIGVLHDRRKPNGRGNIDHLVIGPTGIGVIDTKHYTGLVEPRDKGGWFREDLRLYVRGRDRSALVDGVHRQMGSIRNLVDAEVPIRGVLCFVAAEWKLFARPFEIDGVLVTWLKALLERIQADGLLDAGQRQHWTEPSTAPCVPRDL